MIAETLAVGTELLLGEVVDTNGAWIAAELAAVGVDVFWSQRVGDNLPRVVAAIEGALARSDLLVMCGGLGPTDDDLTREALAAYLHEEPWVEARLEADLHAWFERQGRPMKERNLKQAWLIPSAEALSNPAGTAPGWLVRKSGKIIVALPGPPLELQKMWSEQVVPRLQFPPSHLFRRTIKTFGIGESALVEMLGADFMRQANPTAATYSKRDGVHLRIAAKAADTDIAATMCAPLEEYAQRVLGEYIWGYDGDSLAGCIGQRLRECGQTLATMESLTGGMLAREITAVAGISDVYRGGAVAYWTDVKHMLGVAASITDAHGVVSEETARAMAEAAAVFFGADYALATTGLAGPTASEGKQVGLVFVAAHGAGATACHRLDLGNRGREAVRERATFAALSLLWKMTTP